MAVIRILRAQQTEKGRRKCALVALILREPMRCVAGEEGREIRAQRGLGP